MGYGQSEKSFVCIDPKYKKSAVAAFCDAVFFPKCCPRPPDVTGWQFSCLITLGRLYTGNSMTDQLVM